MKHFELYHKPQFSVREYLIPLVLEYVVLLSCISFHRIFIHMGGLVSEPVMVGDEMTDPTAGRLVFCIIAFVVAAVLGVISSREAKKGNVYIPFLYGSFAGTFLWQSLGEDAWNFAVDGVNFAQLESVSVFPLVPAAILFLVYAAKNDILDWGIWCAVFSFLTNWWGHYVMLGTYPFVSAFFEEAAWNHGVSAVVGVVLLVAGLYLGLCSAKDCKGKIFSAIMTFAATGVLAFGMIEG